jgi:hypothetical protein
VPSATSCWPPGRRPSPCRPGAPLKPLAKRSAAEIDRQLRVDPLHCRVSDPGRDSFAASPASDAALRAAGFDCCAGNNPPETTAMALCG